MKILVTWVGNRDLEASLGIGPKDAGPIGETLKVNTYQKVILLCDYGKHNQKRKTQCKGYVDWLNSWCSTDIEPRYLMLKSPVDFHDIYKAAKSVMDKLYSDKKPPELSLHLSPGTGQMIGVWIILGRTYKFADFVQWSKEAGVEKTDVPFDIAYDYTSRMRESSDYKRKEASMGIPPEGASFGDILYKSKEMAAVVRRAEKIAPRKLPVLIEGETGTGKELFARAIHAASGRSDKPFTALNCGAIPKDLIGSELFGHVKGAFTDAMNDKEGVFETAEGGTLFLDEIAEMPLEHQVNLLRPLQEETVRRVGGKEEIPVNVRIIAATNRDLVMEIQKQNFREDLFHRLNVGNLKIPQLKDRAGDLKFLAEEFLNRINKEFRGEPGFIEKKLSAGAINIIQSYPWPGNVRELNTTLLRATMFAEGEKISKEDMRREIQPIVNRSDAILDLPISEGVDLQELTSIVEKHYITQALKETGQNKTKAASLLGFKSYQNLTNKMESLDIS